MLANKTANLEQSSKCSTTQVRVPVRLSLETATGTFLKAISSNSTFFRPVLILGLGI